MLSDIPSTADLADLARHATVEGAVWTVQSSDLNANLIVLENRGIDEHVNNEVDVLVVGILGAGQVTIDGVTQRLGVGQVVLIPRGARRDFRPEVGRFAYLTCHRRRLGLWPTTPSVSSKQAT